MSQMKILCWFQIHPTIGFQEFAVIKNNSVAEHTAEAITTDAMVTDLWFNRFILECCYSVGTRMVAILFTEWIIYIIKGACHEMVLSQNKLLQGIQSTGIDAQRQPDVELSLSEDIPHSIQSKLTIHQIQGLNWLTHFFVHAIRF